MDLTRPLLTKFAKSLSREKRKELSNVIDEIEMTSYHETRRSILNGLKKAHSSGGLRGLYDNLMYRINKVK